MAATKLLIKHSTLEGIASAVRTKKGTTELIPVSDLESEILNIPTGNKEIKLQKKTVTENKVVTADEGYDGLSEVTVNVEGGTDISELTATRSQVLYGQEFYGLSGRDTGSMEDNGYTNGDSVIELDTTLPSVELNGAYRGTASINLEEKTITENGTYEASEGKVISKVTVNVETDVSDATATASQVLSGQVFYGLSGRDTGTMEDNGYTDGDSYIELDAKYPSATLNGAYRGTASIKFDEDRTITENGNYTVLGNVEVAVEKGTDISDATATRSQVLSGQVFYGLSGRDTGSMEDNGYTDGDSYIELDAVLPSVELNGAYRGTAKIKFDEDREITSNGTYTVLGKVTVNVDNGGEILEEWDGSGITMATA